MFVVILKDWYNFWYNQYNINNGIKTSQFIGLKEVFDGFQSIYQSEMFDILLINVIYLYIYV